MSEHNEPVRVRTTVRWAGRGSEHTKVWAVDRAVWEAMSPQMREGYAVFRTVEHKSDLITSFYELLGDDAGSDEGDHHA